MPDEFTPSEIERKWQEKWEKGKVFEVDFRKAEKPYTCQVMFPYPSGDKLHVGHWYNFGPADTYARFQRMRGYDVFEPIGFDAFGLPAENHALKTGVHPTISIRENVETMTKQLKRIGCMYDWTQTLDTSLPEYYRWTQWLFLKMFEHGLAYRREAPVNHCPMCQTVLANEQVWDGRCERCETEVVQRPLTQWFWKITDYAERLLAGLSALDWPEKTKLMQRNWIGRSEGTEIDFSVQGTEKLITVFTTRQDTLFGATYLVLAPEHPLVAEVTTEEKRGDVEKYQQETSRKTQLMRTDLLKHKTGVATGGFAVNPSTRKPIPIWIADYVIASYGTGAVMGVPGHDQRDYEFAKEYDLPIVEVVKGGDLSKEAYISDSISVNSEFLNGLPTPEAKEAMTRWLEEHQRGRRTVRYKLRDWLISRQRYWGAPIPIVHCETCGTVPVPEKDLPVLLPKDVDFLPKGDQRSPLGTSQEFVHTLCPCTKPTCGHGNKACLRAAKREVDTMDTFVDSSFYQFRYLAEGTQTQFIDPTIEAKWMPVTTYIGGAEHACMHLIYARFVTMALRDWGVVSHEEPFQRLVHQGVITNKGAKMSKSRGNVVSPDEFVERYGSDVFRMYLMFMGPFTDGGDWSDRGITGIARFAKRLFAFLTDPEKSAASKEQEPREVTAALHATVKKVTEDIARFHFNTALSCLMEFLNALERAGSCTKRTAETAAKLLAPLAPHLAEEIWSQLGHRTFVCSQKWPTYRESMLKRQTITIPVQVNGRLRATIEVDADAKKEDVLATARAQPNVGKYLTGKEVKKVVYIAGKLLNLVTT